MFLHRFEQRRLRLGRGAIDFVRKHEMREDRAALKLKLAPSGARFHHDVRAENVGRHEVRRELNAAERQIEHFAQRADQKRLAQAGHAFEQHMAAREQRNQRPLDNGILADDHLAYFRAQAGIDGAEILYLILSAHFLMSSKYSRTAP